MRKLLVGLSTLVLLTCAGSTAIAQNEIVLGGSSATLVFTGTGGGNWSLNWGTVGGTAAGYGIFTSGPAPYSITEPAGTSITGTLTSSNATSATWNISQSNPLKFSFGTGGSLLTGNLELVSLQVTGASSKTGNTDTTLVVDMTNLGGSLAHLFSSGGAVVQLTFHFTGTALSLDSLASNSKMNATFAGGELFQTPEPTSMLLVGSGLLMLGVMVRRRHGKTKT